MTVWMHTFLKKNWRWSSDKCYLLRWPQSAESLQPNFLTLLWTFANLLLQECCLELRGSQLWCLQVLKVPLCTGIKYKKQPLTWPLNWQLTQLSELNWVSNGVPQGSIVGPIHLFLNYFFMHVFTTFSWSGSPPIPPQQTRVYLLLSQNKLHKGQIFGILFL